MSKRYIYRAVEEPEIVHDSDHNDLVQALIHEDFGGGTVVWGAHTTPYRKQEVLRILRSNPRMFNPRVVNLVVDEPLTEVATALVTLERLAGAAKSKTMFLAGEDMARGLLYTLAERMHEQLVIVDRWLEENDA